MSKPTATRQTICLNMIVKDEDHVIRRCLDSVSAIIDTWVIVDTGSTDGTQAAIKSHMAALGIPGELVERPWVNFGHNRSEALEYARGKADYIFIIDADEVLAIDEGFSLPTLTHDAYHLRIRSGAYSYWKTQLVADRLRWRYRGVLHEYIESPDAQVNPVPLEGLVTLRYVEGARSRDPLTYRKDAIILEQALLSEPDNERYVFYLAQSYRDAGMLDRAIACYRQRVEMKRWAEEVWYSLYQIAELLGRQRRDWEEVVAAYLAAYEYRPTRAEPLYRIALHYQWSDQFAIAEMFLERAMAIRYPELDRLFVDASIYHHLLPVETAVCHYWRGRHEDAIRGNNTLLRRPDLPANLFELVIKNRRYSLDARRPAVSGSASVGSVIALVTFDRLTPDLDNCIDSLESQSARPDRVIYVAGDPAGVLEALPDEGTCELLEVDAQPWGAVLAGLLEAIADDDVVFLLGGRDWLADDEAVAAIRRSFEATGCELAYGQYRYANGHLGLAEPPVDAASLRSDASIFELRPLAFAVRGSWLRARRAQVVERMAAASDRESAVRALVAALMTGIECERVEFFDDVHYVCSV
jgi:glycosyltransferase involved in cell wall biosynthesis